MNRLLSIPLFMVGFGGGRGQLGWVVVGGSRGVGGGTTFALPKMCPQTNLLFD